MKWFIVVLLPFELCSKANLNKHGLFTWWKKSDCISAGHPLITIPLTSSKTASEEKGEFLELTGNSYCIANTNKSLSKIFQKMFSFQKMFQSSCWQSKILWTKPGNHKNPDGCSGTLFCIWRRLAPALARAQHREFPRCKFMCELPMYSQLLPWHAFLTCNKNKSILLLLVLCWYACSHLSAIISTPGYTWALGKALVFQIYIQNHQISQMAEKNHSINSRTRFKDEGSQISEHFPEGIVAWHVPVFLQDQPQWIPVLGKIWLRALLTGALPSVSQVCAFQHQANQETFHGIVQIESKCSSWDLKPIPFWKGSEEHFSAHWNLTTHFICQNYFFFTVAGTASTSGSLQWSVPGSLYAVFQTSTFGVFMTKIPQRGQHQNPLPSDKSSEHSRLAIRAQLEFLGLALSIICLFLSWLHFSQRKIPPKAKLLWFGIVWSFYF